MIRREPQHAVVGTNGAADAAHRLDRGDDVRRAGDQRLVARRRRLIEIEHARNAAGPGRGHDRHHEICVTVVEQHGVDAVDRALRRAAPRRQAGTASRRDQLLAVAIYHDQRHRRAPARHADRPRTVDALSVSVATIRRQPCRRRRRRAGITHRAPSRATAIAALPPCPPMTVTLSEACAFMPGAGNRSTRMTMSCTAPPAHRIVTRLSQIPPRLRPRRGGCDARWRPAAAWSARLCAGASACRRPRRARTSARLRARSCRS